MVINNKKFNEELNNSELSISLFSQYSGVPYTTINDLHNNKYDINNCAAGIVSRLAAVLGVTVENILNDINYLDGIKGKYKDIKYVWFTDTTSKIRFMYEGNEVVLDTEKRYNTPSRIKYYNIVAGWMIKSYTDTIKWKRETKEIVERYSENNA